MGFYFRNCTTVVESCNQWKPTFRKTKKQSKVGFVFSIFAFLEIVIVKTLAREVTQDSTYMNSCLKVRSLSFLVERRTTPSVCA